MTDYIRTNKQIDGRAAAALCVEAGMDREQAQRLTSILREAGVLRSAIGVREVQVEEKVNEDPFVELTFENGRKLAGKLCGVVGPILAWSNPFPPEQEVKS